MIQPHIHFIRSPDHDLLDDLIFDVDAPFSVFLEIGIGPHSPVEQDGCDLFGLTLCNGRHLTETLASDANFKSIFGHSILIVNYFSMHEIRNKIDNIFMHCYAEDWNGVAMKLSRFFAWEFENYDQQI
jgi:Immunity protein 8